VTAPSRQGALWISLRAVDHTELYQREGRVRAALEAAFALDDALFRFSRPCTGGYYWCPPLRAGLIDLSALGIT